MLIPLPVLFCLPACITCAYSIHPVFRSVVFQSQHSFFFSHFRFVTSNYIRQQFSSSRLTATTPFLSTSTSSCNCSPPLLPFCYFCLSVCNSAKYLHSLTIFLFHPYFTLLLILISFFAYFLIPSLLPIMLIVLWVSSKPFSRRNMPVSSASPSVGWLDLCDISSTSLSFSSSRFSTQSLVLFYSFTIDGMQNQAKLRLKITTPSALLFPCNFSLRIFNSFLRAKDELETSKNRRDLPLR